MNLFGFLFRDKKPTQASYDDLVTPENTDGALTVNAGTGAGAAFNQLSMDMLGGLGDETALITRYRSMALDPEVRPAIDEVVNELVYVDSESDIVKINVDDVDMSSGIKKRIVEEFENIKNILDFSNKAYYIARNFYVDGRLNYHISIDKDKPHEGIKEARYMDPRKIRLIKELEQKPLAGAPGTMIDQVVREYYIYHNEAFVAKDAVWTSISKGSHQGLMLTKDSVVRVTCDIMNETGTIVLSPLHQAIRPYNQLRMLEDSLIIYRLSRAPERKIFYIDVGNMPNGKVEQYIARMMESHKNKMTYDSSTGEIKSDKNVMTMGYDYWFARRNDRGTQVDTLPGGQNLGELEDILYFQRKLYKALQIPMGRLEQDSAMFNIGRSTEISREEIKFGKMIARLRNNFSVLFDEMLRRQLILKRVITESEWAAIRNNIKYDFIKDNYFQQLKEMDILKEKMATLREMADSAIGVYYSKAFVRRHVLRMTEEDVEQMKKEMEEEAKEEAAANPDGGDF